MASQHHAAGTKEDYEYSRINRFGTAFGARNSSINLGNGNNEAMRLAPMAERELRHSAIAA